MTETEVAEGTWCLDCEFFEIPDDDGDRCMACGCPTSRHRVAKVIVRD